MYFNTLLFPVVAAVALGSSIERPRARGKKRLRRQSDGLANNPLGWIFSAEKHLVNRLYLPVGVSPLAHCQIR